MPFIQVIKNNKRRFIECKCDQCNIRFTRFYSKRDENLLRSRSFTFCSVKCVNESKKLNGKLRQKIEQTCFERFGVNNPSKLEEIKHKKRLTCLSNFGVEHSFQSDKVREKTKKTLFKKYGVEFVSQSKEIQSKIDHQEIALKSHQTKKQNGSYGKSKIENKFYEYLCERFDKENVERQVRVNNWSIDFYIKTIDTYIQFDGVYWHGLNRSVKEIKESDSKRDKSIYKTLITDRKQNEWFNKNNMNLSRVTDEEFMKIMNLPCIIVEMISRKE